MMHASPSAVDALSNSEYPQPPELGTGLYSVATKESSGGGRFWPTGDGLHSLNAYPKPDAQGAASKVSFAVLYSSVARPGFGQERKFA